MTRYSNRTLIRDVITSAFFEDVAFRAGELFQDVANTNTKKILLQNDTTEFAIGVVEPTVRGSGQAFVSKTANATIDTLGDEVTVTNKRTDGNQDGGITAVSGGDNETGVYTGGTSYPMITIGSGSNRANATPGDTGTGGLSDVIVPGDNLVIEAQNQSGGTQDYSITFDYVKFPVEWL